MGASQSTGTRDTTYDLISVIYHALQGAQTYQIYADDAERSGDREAAAFFREALEASRHLADHGKQLLGQRVSQGSGSQSNSGS